MLTREQRVTSVSATLTYDVGEGDDHQAFEEDRSHRPSEVKATITASIQYCERVASRGGHRKQSTPQAELRAYIAKSPAQFQALFQLLWY